MNLKRFLPDMNSFPTVNHQLSSDAFQLKSSGAKFYGVNGCKFCDMQKKELGSQYKNVYVDCDDGKNKKVCKNLEGFPTWEIHGKFYPGFMKKVEVMDIIRKK